jgi:predicted RNase H-like HicB family nuclease
MEFTVLLSPGEDGFVVAQCPDFPGCITQGKDEADALANIREAIELCLESGETPVPAEVKRIAV